MFSVRLRIESLVGFALLATPAPGFAGAWLMEAGKGQAAVTATSSSATSVFDGDTNRKRAPRYDKFELQGLLEYGMADWLTGILSPGLQNIRIGAPTDAERTGLAYTELGVRTRIAYGDSWILSGQALLRIPGTFDTTNPAAIGYTDPEFDMRAMIGKSFSVGERPAFIDLQLAQRVRNGEPPNEFRADMTFGIRPTRQWQLLAQSFNVISEGAGSPTFPSYNYHKLQLSAVHEIFPQWSLQLGGFTTYAGRNALQENGLLLGSWYKF